MLTNQESSYNGRVISCNNTLMKREHGASGVVSLSHVTMTQCTFIYKNIAQFCPGSFVGVFL